MTRCGVITLITFFVATGLANASHGVLDRESSASILAVSCSHVEIDVWRLTAPCHHVKYVGFAPTEAAGVGEGPREEHLHAEGLDSVDCFVDKLPLILEATGCIRAFERCDSHYEVVFELDRDCKKTSVFVIVPLLKDYEIFF